MRVYSLQVGVPAVAKPVAPAGPVAPKRRSSLARLAAGIAALIVVVGGAWGTAFSRLLADRGQHRGPAIPDLLVAATAEIANLTVLALDKDFDLIASITGQPVERLRL